MGPPAESIPAVPAARLRRPLSEAGPASLPHLNAPRRIMESLERLVQLYDAWGKPAPAAEWKQKLAAFQQANKVSDNKSKTP